MKKKNTSDRKKLSTKYFEQKKRTARKSKLKRDKKKNPNKHHTKKSDPGIPSACPFKKEILEERQALLDSKTELSRRKDQMEKSARSKLKQAEVAAKRKLPATSIKYDYCLKVKKVKLDTEVQGMEGDEEMAEEVMDDETRYIMEQREQAQERKRQVKINRIEFSMSMALTKNRLATSLDPRFIDWGFDKERYTEARKVVMSCDVIMQVLDARDPLGTRCSVMENLVKSTAGKKLVLILNKADLVPKRNLENWLNYLRVDHPTVAFKAATKRPKLLKKTIDRMLYVGEECARTPASMGSNVLLQLLKNYARSAKFAALTVGVVGLPNVGKSSLVNSLKKEKVCVTSSLPGSTKYLTQVKLDKKLYLMDSPGIVFPNKDMNHVEAVLKNVVNIGKVDDPVAAAKEIYDRCDKMKLLLFYEMRKVNTFDEFIALFARRFQALMKGGIMDLKVPAKKLIYDWTHGYLKHYTEPPKRNRADVTTKVVSTMNNFMVDDPFFCTAEEVFLSSLPQVRPVHTMRTVGTPMLDTCEEKGMQPISQREGEEAMMADEDAQAEMEVADQEDESDGNDENEEGPANELPVGDTAMSQE